MKKHVFTLFLWAFIPFLCISQTTLVSWNFTDGNNIADGGIAANSAVTLNENADGIPSSAASGGSPPNPPFWNVNGWDGGVDLKNWNTSAFSTSGYSGISLSSKQRSSDTGPTNFKLQYSLNGTSFTDISGGTIVVLNNWTSGVVVNISLPSECDNQATVYIRWIMTSNTSVGMGTVGGGGTSGIDDIQISASTVLPVELTSLSAKAFENSIYLEWETFSEINCTAFKIEHKASDAEFYEIGKIDCSGNSIAIKEYSFSHFYPTNGINYYLLKQVDFDGNYEYSPIISINFHPKNQISLHPNPISGNDLTLLLPEEYLEENLRLEIFTHTGQRIKSLTAEPESKLQLDLSDLPPGAYFLKAISGARAETLKFLRQ